MTRKKIEIRHHERVSVDRLALEKVIKKFSKVKNNVVVSFDNRISDYGQYFFEPKKKAHTIKISPRKNILDTNGSLLSSESSKYQIISTLLHEMRHAQQKESVGSVFNRFSYYFNKRIKETYFSYFFSECELDARKYEVTHINSAIKMYNKYAK